MSSCRVIVLCLVVSAGLGSYGCKQKVAARKERTIQPTESIDSPDAIAADVPAVTRRLSIKPLPLRDGADGPRFESLPVEQTGLNFCHNWTPPPGYQLKIYQESLPGGSVCIGDYDGDGLPDVFLTQPQVGSSLYRNLGGMRFQDVTDSTVGRIEDGLGACFADIDNDGDLDLFVCRDEKPNQCFINNGDGSFTERGQQMGLGYSGASIMMYFADYDCDGDLDGYLVTNVVRPPSKLDDPPRRPDGKPVIPDSELEYRDSIRRKDGTYRVISAAQYDHLFRNDGNGTFTEVSDEAGITGNYFGLAASWWDYNRDGWPDIYVANDFFSPDQLYRNNKDGTFTDVAPEVIPHTPWYSMGCDSADINNDGWLDLMGSDMSGSSHYLQKASMGNMADNNWFLDFPVPRQYMRNAMYVNTGTGRFMETAHMSGLANTDWTWSLKFGDLDEDGWTDLYVTNGVYRDWTNSDLRGQSNAAKTTAERMELWLNSEQKKDENFAFRNLGDCRFEPVGQEWGLGVKRVSSGAAFADLDGDGDLDIVVNNAKEVASVYRNNTSDSHRVVIRLKGTKSNKHGIGATVSLTTADEDGTTQTQTRFLNLAQGYMSCNEPMVHFGLGAAGSGDRQQKGPRIKELKIQWPSGTHQVFTDLAVDNCYEVTEPETFESAPPPPLPTPVFNQSELLSLPHREFPFDDFAEQPLLPNKLSQLGPGIACADVDGDDDIDLFVGGAAGQAGQLLINESGEFYTQFGGPWESDVACEDMGVLFLDVEGDGDADLYVVSGGIESKHELDLADRLYMNDGSGQFAKASPGTLSGTSFSGSVVCSADFDGDGDLDLFVGGRVIPGQYPLSPGSVLLRNDNGTFKNVTAELAPQLSTAGMVTSATWTDLDNDGSPDLLVSQEWGTIRLIRYLDGRLVDVTGSTLLQTKSGWYNSLATGDLDNDGDLDIVAGNFGLNLKYHATDEKPTKIYYGDFEQTGQMRIVEAEYEEATLFPVRGKSCSTHAMPFLEQKFTKYHDFALASLEEIYTPSCLEDAREFSANSLETCVWLNNGKGDFEFIPLPTLAQVAPVFGIAIGHFNDDEHPDIVLAQNFFGPQVETGRADGGVSLLLAGQGDGQFAAVPASESGVVIPGDATALVSANLDQDPAPELLVATNDGPVSRLDLVRHQNFLQVQLIGRAGNRDAVGAKVRAIYGDGSQHLAEVSSGSGYLSQSARHVSLRTSDDKPLREISVTWPDGSTSVTEPSGGKTLVITHP